MRAENFRSVCRLLWGAERDSWGAEGAAKFLKVNIRNVYYWSAGSKVIPDGVPLELGKEIHRRLMDPDDQTPGILEMRQAMAHSSAAA